MEAYYVYVEWMGGEIIVTIEHVEVEAITHRCEQSRREFI
jgi:hypothetical protein